MPIIFAIFLCLALKVWSCCGRGDSYGRSLWMTDFMKRGSFCSMVLAMMMFVVMGGCSDADVSHQRPSASMKQYGQIAKQMGDRSILILKDVTAQTVQGDACRVSAGQVMVYEKIKYSRRGLELSLTNSLKGCQGKEVVIPLGISKTATTPMSGQNPSDQPYYHHPHPHWDESIQLGWRRDPMKTDIIVDDTGQRIGQYDLVFPLYAPPLEDFKSGGREFGAWRDGGTRRHAANDLVEFPGQPVYAVADGQIIDFYEFYYGTYAVVVDHGRFVVRYGEVSGMWEGLKVGSSVRAGQKIAVVGHLHMLHFEKYAGTHIGHLTNRANPPFQRREDLIRPTDFLQSLLDHHSYPATW